MRGREGEQTYFSADGNERARRGDGARRVLGLEVEHLLVRAHGLDAVHLCNENRRVPTDRDTSLRLRGRRERSWPVSDDQYSLRRNGEERLDVRVGAAIDLAQTVIEANRVNRARGGRAEAGDEGRVRLPADVLVLGRVGEHAPICRANDER